MMNTPVRKTMCETCPFKEGSPYAILAEELLQSALTDCSRTCHSTGANNAINKRTGIKPHLCRGARDFQLRFMAESGVIEAPTDEAWNETRVKLGMKPIKTVDPT